MTKHCESYLHRYAKVTLSSWLRKKIRIGPNFKGLNNIDLSGASSGLSKLSPMYGVYTEYPVCSDGSDQIIGLTITWSEWLTKNNITVNNKTNIPTVYDIKQFDKKLKVKLLYVFDVAIVDSVGIKYVFEIEHKNPSTPEKVQFLLDRKIIGYEISAQKIMEQVKLPYNIEFLHYWSGSVSNTGNASVQITQ